MPFIKHAGVSGVIAALAVSAAQAQDEKALEQVLVTGSYAPLPDSAFTATVSVLDAAEIQAQNKRNLADLLRTVPGLLVEQQGGPGGLTAVSIRGGESNFTLVMLNGVPLNDPTNTRGGGVDLANFDPSGIEQIEIVRGPQSAVYGSDALAGVINIITRRGSQGVQWRLRGEAGGSDFGSVSAAVAGAIGEVDYAFNIVNRDDGEPVPGSTRDTTEVLMNLGWTPGEAHELRLNLRHLEGERTTYPEQSGGPLLAATDDLDNSDYEDQTLGLQWAYRVNDLWRSSLIGSRFELEEEYSSPGIFPFIAVPPQETSTEFTRDLWQWVNTLTPSDAVSLNIGADWRREDGTSEGTLDFGFALLPTDFALIRETKGYFVEATGEWGPATLQGSLRRDEPDDFDGETTARIGLSFALTSELDLRANWGEGFKLPSFFALGHALVGNPELKPERGESVDLGLTWNATDTLYLEATLFANEYEDLVDFDPEDFINVNRNRVDTSGMELVLAWQPLETLQIQGQATYTDIDLKSETGVLTGRPEHKSGLTGAWQFSRRWDALLDYQWTGEQFAASLHTGETVVETLDDFHRVDWRLRWQALPALRLELSIDNLLDADYQTAVGFPAVGRTVRFALNLGSF